MTFVDVLLTYVLPLLGTLGGAGGLVTLVKARAERKRIEAEREQIEAAASETITRTALSLIDPLSRRITEIECERDGLLERVESLETALARSNERIRELQRDLTAAQARITELEAEREQLREENASYRQIIEERRTEVE